MDWPLAEAKNKLSEVFDRALKDGPQRISRRGKDRVVVIAEVEYLAAIRKPAKGGAAPKSFKDFLLSLQAPGSVKLERYRGPDRGRARHVKL